MTNKVWLITGSGSGLGALEGVKCELAVFRRTGLSGPRCQLYSCR